MSSCLFKMISFFFAGFVTLVYPIIQILQKILFKNNMTNFFRKLSLSVKLILIGAIPILLLIYFTFLIYNEKKQKLVIMKDYVHRIELSSIISRLNGSLGNERQYSFNYLLRNENHDLIDKQRVLTDSLIDVIEKYPDVQLHSFTDYTFLYRLNEIRNQIDRFPQMDPNTVVDYYTRCIFRLNTLNAWIPPTSVYSPKDYQDLVTLRILREMITLLDIIRTNIYNVLYTDKYKVETLMGTNGVYTVYNSYKTEFKQKASTSAKAKMDSLARKPEMIAINSYIDSLFATFEFKDIYNADQWWALSSAGIVGLKAQQSALSKHVIGNLVDIYQEEKRSLNYTIIFLSLMIISVFTFIFFTINNITRLLREIKLSARKISRGETGISLPDMPRGMIGSLAKSILQIEKNNLVLARAAGEIGKGNFSVSITPRSEQDILAVSLKKMKQDLRYFTSQKDRLQQETMALVYQRDDFFSMTSHELKTPVTSLKAYTQLLILDGDSVDVESRKEMLQKMEKQINKLVTIINDLLDTSRLQYNQLVYTKLKFRLNKLVAAVISELQLSYPDHRIIFQKNVNAEVLADSTRINQVINNLLVNAIKYSPDSREIIVRLEKNENSVIFSVKDFGYGIRDSEKDKIFERFYRISGGNLHTYPGLGLGLYISREIIEKHDGKLWFESEYGKGTTFYFELPLAES